MFRYEELAKICLKNCLKTSKEIRGHVEHQKNNIVDEILEANTRSFSGQYKSVE